MTPPPATSRLLPPAGASTPLSWLVKGGGLPRHQHTATTDPANATDRDEGAGLFCHRCGTRITDISQRIAMGGKHHHTLFNPHGVVFDVGCFRQAPGCGVGGVFTRHFTWFPGFLWRMAHCGACGQHLGWLYWDGLEQRFFGLILTRLREKG